jgi:hypothetical protein
MQISRVQAKYNANILFIQTQLILNQLSPYIIVSKDEGSINVLDTDEQKIHSLPIGN